MDFAAFSHGQIHSKIWLCEELEKHISRPYYTAILGSWYSLTSFLLLVRNQHLYTHIDAFDIDSHSIDIAKQINNAWYIVENKVNCIQTNVNDLFYGGYDLIICTSTEDIQGTQWFDNIPNGKLVCLQSVDLTPEETDKFGNWHIINSNQTFNQFKEIFPLSTTLYEGTKEINYGHFKYNRFMLIGIK
jgi:hypothetical protein